MVDGITPAVVFPVFNFVLRGVQTAYEIAAVPAETSDYLQSISQVFADIKVAKKLRRQKNDQLAHDDLVRIDNAIINTEEAVSGVAVLVEKARVDMSCNFGKVGACNRIMWVMRDSTKISAAIARLALASQSLNREILTLQFTPARNCSPYEGLYASSTSLVTTDSNWQPGPPSYLEATMKSMSERRDWNSRRASIRNSLSSRSASPSVHSVSRPFNPSDTGVEFLSSSAVAMARYIQENEATFAALSPSATTRPPQDPTPAPLIEYPSGFAELESNDLAQQMSENGPPVPPKPTASAFMQPQGYVGTASTRVDSPRPPMQAPSGEDFATSYQKTRKNRLISPQYLPTTSSGSMTTIPGLKNPIHLRFAEDSHTKVTCQQPNTTNPNPFADPETSSLEDIDNQDHDTPTTRPVTGARKRPARIQRDFSLQIENVSQPTTARVSSRRAGAGMSRTEWQVEQQKLALSKLNKA